MRVWHPVPQVNAGDSGARDEGKSGTPDERWQCITTLSGNSFLRTIRSVAWGVDGRSLAAACFDATATVLELMGGKEPSLEAAVSLEGHDSEVKSVSYSSSGGLLASASRDRSVWIWEVGLDFDYECVAVLNGHSGDVKCVRWHPSSEILLSCSYDNEIRVWVEDEDDWFCLEQLTAHDSTVWAVSFDKTGQQFVSVGDGGVFVVWQRVAPPAAVVGAHPRYTVVTHMTGLHDGPIYSVDWARETNRIATAGEDDSIRILRCEDGSDGVEGESNGEGSSRGEVAGEDVDEAARPPKLRTETDQKWIEEHHVPRAHSGPVNCVAWNPADNSVLASCGDDGLVRIWKCDKT